MQPTFKDNGPKSILLQSVRLCQSIHPYIDILGLNRNEVRNFTDQIQAAMYITENYRSFAGSFLLHNMAVIRVSKDELVNQCKDSPNYTR